jgi:hypothetical protein
MPRHRAIPGPNNHNACAHPVRARLVQRGASSKREKLIQTSLFLASSPFILYHLGALSGGKIGKMAVPDKLATSPPSNARKLRYTLHEPPRMERQGHLGRLGAASWLLCLRFCYNREHLATDLALLAQTAILPIFGGLNCKKRRIPSTIGCAYFLRSSLIYYGYFGFDRRV